MCRREKWLSQYSNLFTPISQRSRVRSRTSTRHTRRCLNNILVLTMIIINYINFAVGFDPVFYRTINRKTIIQMFIIGDLIFYLIFCRWNKRKPCENNCLLENVYLRDYDANFFPVFLFLRSLCTSLIVLTRFAAMCKYRTAQYTAVEK